MGAEPLEDTRRAAAGHEGPLGDDHPSDTGGHRAGVRRARRLIIAGAAPTPLEQIQNAERHLSGILKRWRRPDKVTMTNVQDAERLMSTIFETLEDRLDSSKIKRAYDTGGKRDIQRFYDHAMDKTGVFKRVLQAYKPAGTTRREPRQVQDDTTALFDAQRDMINAVRDYQQAVVRVVSELVRIAKEPFPGRG